MSWRPVGVWAVDFLCCCGDRGGLPVPTPERRGLAPGSALATPLGVVVPGPRSIECIWGVWVWVPCPFLCVYMWGEGVNIRLRAWGWEHMLVYMCACRLRLCVRSGLRLRLTHHLSRPPPHTMPCRWRMPPVRWWFLAPGQDARASAGPLSAVDWLGLALLALLGPDCGVGGLWVSGPRARSALGWSAAGGACGPCRHGTLGRLHCGCRRSRLRALLCPFLGGGRGCPCGGSPGGPVPWGSLDVWGPGLFRACFMPCGMGLLFPTHTIKHLHGGTLWTQARSHTQVYTQAFTLV